MSRRKRSAQAGKRQHRQERVASRALARGRVFGLLARALRYPDADLFCTLKDGRWAGELDRAARQSGMGRRDPFLAELQRLPETLPAELTDLQGHHTALFSSNSICAHQESDYVAGHLFQKTVPHGSPLALATSMT